MPTSGITSLLFTIQDSGSAVLKAIGDQTKALDKETQELAQAYAALDKANAPLISRYGELKTALEKSNAVVAEAKKAFKEFGDEALDAWNMDEAIANQKALQQELKDVESQIKSNQSTLSSYRESLRKGSVEADGLGGIGGGETSILSALGQAGLFKELGGVASQWGSTLAGSLLGDAGSSMLGSVLNGVGSGAAIGNMVLPGGIGALAGAALGGVVGAASGAAQSYQAKDDAFISYYNGLYEDVNAATEETISGGSATAGSREQTRIAFAQRLGGYDEADEYLAQVEEMAALTNYSYDEIVGYAKTLLNSYDSDEVFGVLQTLSDASGGLGLDSSDVNQMIQGLYMLRVNDTANDQYLKYFRNRGIDTSQALADYLGVDPSEVSAMVSGGEISGEDAAQAMLEYINNTYGGLSEAQAATYDAMVDNLNDIMTTLNATGGDAYNEARKEGVQAEMDAYGGALGDAVSAINVIAGENKAYLENLSEQYQREALGAVLLGEDTTVFTEADQAKLEELRAAFEAASEEYEDGSQEAGLKMEALKEDAEALATAAYESSEQYQLLQDVRLDQITAIRENTEGLAAATNAYSLAQEMSKGMAGGIVNTVLEKSAALTADITESDEFRTAVESEDTAAQLAYGKQLARKLGYSHAYGLDRVPYDGYPALLHADERVLTASEARAQDAERGGVSIQITVTGNTLTGTSEEMADELAEIIVRKVERAAAAMIPR